MLSGVTPPLAFSIWRNLSHLGGPGLLILGLADNSLIPLTGSMDVLTIYLAARHQEPWPYYAFMATLGAVIGGYVTYQLAQRGGKPALARRLSPRQATRLYESFERWGFAAVAIPAMLPPPFPIVPFLLAAGALQYERRKFLAALTLGRSVRFTLIAALGAFYGPTIVKFFSQYYKLTLATLIGLAIAGGMATAVSYYRRRRHRAATPTGG